MKSLIIGMGQIGGALYELFPDSQTLDLNEEEIKLPIDIMHVCIPYNNEFMVAVQGYIDKYQPKHVVVYSTVAIGTCKKLGNNVVHSPVEGKHPLLAKSMRLFTRWIGGPKETATVVQELWKDIVPCKLVKSSDYTEFLKLQSTSKYGINIVFADYVDKTSSKLGMDYDLVKEFDADYNRLYSRLRYKQYRRYILDPPKGKIGGHCVRENSFILDEQFPNDVLKMIGGFDGI